MEGRNNFPLLNFLFLIKFAFNHKEHEDAHKEHRENLIE
jgi:hypothetical protein